MQFDARAMMVNRKKPHPCPSCFEPANPIPPSSVRGHFKKEVSGPQPQNTGIHDLDTHIDRVIGQSAKQGRDVIEHRVRRKQEIMYNEGVSGDRLSKNPDGSYSVLKPEEGAAHKRALKIHEKAGEWARLPR